MLDASSLWFTSKTLKLFFIEVPKALLINLFLSNLVTETSLRQSVDWAEVNLLNNSAFFEIWEPNPQLVIILFSLIKYSKERGPDC